MWVRLNFWVASFLSLVILSLSSQLYAKGKSPNVPCAEDVYSTSYGMFKFGWKVYHLSNRKAKSLKNTTISPLSLYLAFSLCREGTAGETRREVEEALGIQLEGLDYTKAIGHIQKKLLSQKNVQFHLANRLWVDNTFSLHSHYQSLCQKYYRASVGRLDFRGSPEPSRLQINRWVEGETKGKIKDLLPARSIGSDTRAVLVNALYFYGNWQVRFDKRKTRESAFYASTGTVQVPMMFVSGRFRYGETKLGGISCQVLELPYKGKEMCMVLVLPAEGSGNLQKLERLSADALWKVLVQRRFERNVKVYLPRWKAEDKVDMEIPDLQSLGFHRLTSPSLADFSAMTSEQELFVSQAIHKTFIEVNEEGTEAAAATAIIMSKGSVSKPRMFVFRANRPFLYFLFYRPTQTVLFVGKVENPK